MSAPEIIFPLGILYSYLTRFQDNAQISNDIFPNNILPGNGKGLRNLASSLVTQGVSMEQVMLIVGLLSSDSESYSNLTEWEDIPIELHDWIQAQNGLKVDRQSVASTGDLFRIHRLLCRSASPLGKNSSILSLALDVAIRYFKQVLAAKGTQGPMTGCFIQTTVVPRKCGLCNQRILDDAYPRFKRRDPKRYVLRFLQNGCGLPGCPGNRQGV